MNNIEPGHMHNTSADSTPGLNNPAAMEDTGFPADEGIVSVNSKASGPKGNRVAKSLFVAACVAIVIGGLVWFGQNWITQAKQHLRSSAGKPGTEGTNMFNPEGSRIVTPKTALGAAGQAPRTPGETKTDDSIRAMRGPDGKVLVNAQGNALGVDRDGQVTEVPAIGTVGGDTFAGRKPLPNSAPAAGTPGPQSANSANLPSRFGGALFADSTGDRLAQQANTQNAPAKDPTQNALDMLRAANSAAQGGASGQSGLFPMGNGAANAGQPAAPKPGSIGAQLSGSATPVAKATRIADQNLMLPRGRQADCILTTRINDQLPGFTSCVLAQNMYSDNGRVLLLERGSEITGEYGTSNQTASNRLFVLWSRAKTPDGIAIDFSSPGADSLGGSGIPGFLDKRWMDRIGAAFMLSIFRDGLAAAIANKYPPAPPSVNGVAVSTQPTNTLKTTDSVADALLQEGMKSRPTISINEGERISIYIARDLDFSAVYQLRASGTPGAVRIN